METHHNAFYESEVIRLQAEMPVYVTNFFIRLEEVLDISANAAFSKMVDEATIQHFVTVFFLLIKELCVTRLK